MSVYKELFYTVEQIEKKSVRIYPDACDYGVPIFSNTDPLILMVKGIKEQYDGVVSTESYDTGATQTVKILGFDEWCGKQEILFTFTYVFVKEKYRKGLNGAIGYLNVERK